MRRMLHHFDRRRIGQTRGFPYLSPVIEPLKQLGEYTDAEVMAAVISSMFSVFVTTPDGSGLGLSDDPAKQASDPNDAVKLGYGAIVDLMPGEKIEIADPKRPNIAFDPFVQAILRQVGVALELPFEVLIKHFTSSYTAARAAILEAWKFFRVRREWVVKSFLAPIYEAWMEEAVAAGRLSAPGFFDDPLIRKSYLGCRWIGDAPGQIDPVKEITAAGLRLEEGITTLEEETITMTGGDWEENTAQQALELTQRKAAGLISSAPGPVGINGKPNNTIPPGQEGNEQVVPEEDSDLEDGGPKK
jgi:lambda family phage portal protein